jgi:succinate dehydrogenase hydrophobic anchor subunit
MNKLTRGAIVGGTFLLPMLAFAQNTVQLFNWVGAIRTLINALIPIALALIFLMIIWNAYKLVSADGEEKAEYRGDLIKMIVVFFVVMSIYGIVYFIGKTLGIGQGGTAAIPCVTGQYNPATKLCE